MSLVRNLSVAVVSLATISCFTKFSVPKDLRGDVPLLLTNNTPYGICTLQLTFADGSVPVTNWVHTGVFHPDGNERRKFKVKPGVYRLHLESCDHNLVHDIEELPIEEPTELVVTAIGERFNFTKPIAAAPGFRQLPIDIQLSEARQRSEQEQLDSATQRPSCQAQFDACGGQYGSCCEGLYCKEKDNDVSWCWSETSP